MPDFLRILELILPAVIIFILRIITVALYTLRLRMTTMENKAIAWILAIIQATIYILTFIAVISDLDDWLKLLSYTTGFATGMVVGMMIEERIAIGYTLLRVISSGRGTELTEKLRQEGYAVTEVAAHGKDGTVTLLNCNVRRKKSHQVENLIMKIDPTAFITALPVIPVQKGFWGK